MPVQFTEGCGAEGLGKGAGHGKAVAEHGLQHLGPQRLQVIAGGNALGQLAQLGPSEGVPQFGLAHEDNLQEFALPGFEIGEKAQLLEGLGA